MNAVLLHLDVRGDAKPGPRAARYTTEGGLPVHMENAILVHPVTDCWLWQQSKSRDGYGWVSLNGKNHQAHRLAYRLLIGEPPAGTVLDHLCRVRHCVNPDHMQPVTPGDNIRRSPVAPAGMTNCLTCGSGLTPLGKQRRCLSCLGAYRKEYYAKHKRSAT